MNMYGSHLCPDVLYAISVLKAKGIDFNFFNVSADLGHLKAFIKIREANSCFDKVKECDGIGIPCFEKDNGEITFDLEEIMK